MHHIYGMPLYTYELTFALRRFTFDNDRSGEVKVVKDLVESPAVVSGDQVIATELGFLLGQLDHTPVRMLATVSDTFCHPVSFLFTNYISDSGNAIAPSIRPSICIYSIF